MSLMLVRQTQTNVILLHSTAFSSSPEFEIKNGANIALSQYQCSKKLSDVSVKCFSIKDIIKQSVFRSLQEASGGFSGSIKEKSDA